MITMKAIITEKPDGGYRLMLDSREQVNPTKVENTIATFLYNLMRNGLAAVAKTAHFGEGDTLEQAEQSLEIDRALDPKNFDGPQC